MRASNHSIHRKRFSDVSGPHSTVESRRRLGANPLRPIGSLGPFLGVAVSAGVSASHANDRHGFASGTTYRRINTTAQVSQPRPTPSLLTPSEVALLLRISPPTVARYGRDGRIERVKVGASLSRDMRRSVLALVEPSRTTTGVQAGRG